MRLSKSKPTIKNVLKDDVDFYNLFADASQNERKQLIIIYESLLKFYHEYSIVFTTNRLKSLLKVIPRFKYLEETGIQGLIELFSQKSDDLEDIIKKIGYLDDLIHSDVPIIIKTTKKNEDNYSFIIIDEKGDEVFGFINSVSHKLKFFENIDDTYKHIGNHREYKIFQKNNEIGFQKTIR